MIRDLRARDPAGYAPWTWTRATRIRLVILAALIPVEVALFRSGGIESPQNMIGVGLVFWQWILLNRAIAGARASPAQGAEEPGARRSA